MKFVELLGRFTAATFSWRLLPLHALAVLVTIAMVMFGFDWLYLVFVLENLPSGILPLADLVGFVWPAAVVVGLLVLWLKTHSIVYKIYLLASLQAILLGLFISTTVKIFTGRTSPPHRHRGGELVLIDNSHAFHFGFLREQIMGGWPSSHATVAFALATALTLVVSGRWGIKTSLWMVTFFIGIGVTFGFHWLSEFVAGACLGTAIGMVIGRYYQDLLTKN